MSYHGFMTRVLKNPNQGTHKSIGLNFFGPSLCLEVIFCGMCIVKGLTISNHFIPNGKMPCISSIIEGIEIFTLEIGHRT
jgi:hypothetical protein